MKTIGVMYFFAALSIASIAFKILIAQSQSTSMDVFLGAIVTIFITLYTIVVLPTVNSARKDAREAKAEAKACRIESDEWRGKYLACCEQHLATTERVVQIKEETTDE